MRYRFNINILKSYLNMSTIILSRFNIQKMNVLFKKENINK